MSFKSNNGVSYEVISSYMYKLSPHPTMDFPILFERYPGTKKCLKGVDIEISVKGGIATFRGEIFRMSTFTIGEPGEPYCMIPGFLGTIIKGSRIDFCKKDFQLIRSTIGLIFD